MAGCAEGDLPLWPGRAHRIPIRYTTGRTPRIIVKLHLDGHPIDAILDSGAWRTVISTSDAHAAGVTDGALRHDPTRNSIGIDDNDNRTYLHQFDTLRIGDDFVLNHPQLAVTDTDQTLLGADFFRTHRVWLSRRQDAMYVQALQEGRPAPDAPR
ncbi:conserved hypothetical protein [Gluconacetobacter diazotrophicus PA1 5]|uniref:retropepsin-like aspartic protease family protein n=1 Tax=Gluconacetobacter diazotrophicus TaxID=33996 RepID=UPI000173C14B|nr:retropepsin-like aspartic protease [Gluconacetobacter diazotrophicus]ACI52116.1 conserved hypothetical protein [Gluconacetobacter diazotrophicus PA1 5]TWB01034.1 gag-polyprotein putative aspartyl protease [Gluconacetobacter diazotrophicus]